MKKMRAIALAAFVAATGPAQATDVFPGKPVRIIVTFSPGGSADVVARMIAPKLSAELGQSVVIENRPGASGVIGSALLASSAPDGYTMGITSTSQAAAPFAMKLTFDMAKDIRGVTLIMNVPNVLAAGMAVPANNLQEVLALARAKPGELSYGHAGNFTASDFGMALLKQQARVQMISVPYKGGGPALLALLSNDVTLAISGPPPYLPHIKAGKIKAIATTGLQRSPALPTVPTFAESGVPGFDITDWYGLSVPAHTPEPVVKRLNEALVKVIKSPDITQAMAAQGAIAVANSPQEFDAFFAKQSEKYGALVRDLNLKPD
ncbi:MAG: uncharacterized protein JWN73_1304 [Betaproteobacteria bacterium]|nr:uncharacterized protein [Betaproteobacteria bacterium]